MTEEEKIICKSFLHDVDNTHSCNEYKLLMELLEQEPTTKNDLGVDCVRRKAVLNTLERMDKVLDEDRTVDSYKELLKECYKVLPSVTPQESRKGHWIEHEESISTAFKHLRECSCCKCYFDWLMPRNSFCPNCGADMREVSE